MKARSTPRLHVDIVSDVMCPWCIIGWLKFERAMARFSGQIAFRVRWHPFELNPAMPAQGEDAAEHVSRKYGLTPERARANSDQMARIAAELGFHFNRGPGFRMRNSFDAHRLLSWAAALEDPDLEAPTGVQTALKLALFAAHFSDNRDVSEHAVLADVAAEVGLDRNKAVSILASGEFGTAVRNEEEQWYERGISAVPAFILDGRFLVPGAQEPETFIGIIERRMVAQDG